MHARTLDFNAQGDQVERLLQGGRAAASVSGV
jgi:hypothetical protein